ncbi:6-bladed beta-propeller [Rhodohalobacter sp. 8-1]|uniref:6-bladed beta-propeller n=1 Tax=Rhodohalobacter sp. 8-1 TaxID=3131972 RepID=UPI0030ED3437
MVRLCVSALVFVILGCSSEPEIDLPEEVAALENVSVFLADSEPEMELTLTKEVSFGDTDELFLGGFLRSVTDKDGRVILADFHQTQLHLYNADGSYNRPIGREGEGPGEYRQIGTMRTGDQFLHLMDRGLNRITRYDLETFEVAGEASLAIKQTEGENFRYPQDFHLTDNDEYLILVGSGFSAGVTDDSRRPTGGLKLGWNGDSLSTESLFSFDASEALVHREGGSMRVMSVPYKRSSVISFQNNQLIHVWNEHFLLSLYDENGEY